MNNIFDNTESVASGSGPSLDLVLIVSPDTLTAAISCNTYTAVSMATRGELVATETRREKVEGRKNGYVERR